MKDLLICTLLLFAILGCTKDEENTTAVEPTEQNLSVESNNVKTFEVVSVKVDNVELTNTTYQATFGKSEITLVKYDDNALIFSVPEIEEGTYALSLSLGTIELSVTKTQVSNTDEIIQNVFKNFNNDISHLDDDDLFIANEITEAESYNTDVLALYYSLNDEQKRQTAMFYEANKEVFENFKKDIASSLNGPTTLSKTPQSDCPTDDFKSFYSCTANNLGNSAVALKNSSKEFLQLLALAGAAAYLAPASFGLSAAGTFLALGTAAYIYMTEVRVSFIQFKSSLRSFIGANWILTQATFSVITDEFSSESEASLNVLPDFRSINSKDSGISQETGDFINSLNTLNGYWNQLTALYGNTLSYQDTSENFDYDVNSDHITITNISNSNVELQSLNGQNATFKSLSGTEESFSFDVEIIKEGFTERATVNAYVLEKQHDYKLQIGNYNQDYSQISVLQTLQNEDTLTVPNYMTQMVRLTLDNVPVAVGSYGLEWTPISFGETPSSQNDINIENYVVTVMDATNNVNVSINLNVTLTNQSYSRFMGSTIKCDDGTNGIPNGTPRTITINNDGSFSVTYYDGSNAGSGTLSFVDVISESNNVCSTYTETRKKIGCIRLSGGSSGLYYWYPEYIYLYEDNTLSANSFYGCNDRTQTWHLK